MTRLATTLIAAIAVVSAPRTQGDWTDGSRKLLETAAGRESKRLQRAHRVLREHVELVFAPGRIDGCPVSKLGEQAALFATRMEQARSAFLETLDFAPGDLALIDPDKTTASQPNSPDPFAESSSRLHIYVLRDEVLHRRLCPRLTGLTHQGLGSKRFGPRAVYSVLQNPKHLGTDAALHRNLVHNVTHLLLSAVSPHGWIGERGHGWLDAGLAHHFESALVDGSCDCMCHHERAQLPLLVSGNWIDRARTARNKRYFATFRRLFGKDTSRLSADEHLFAFALVRYLVTRDGRRLGRAIRGMKHGKNAQHALESAFECSLSQLEAAFAAWLDADFDEAAAATLPSSRAALYLYTRPFVRPRHRQVVAKAIEQRASAHESGWQIRKRKPALKLGPVKRAAHWKGKRIVKPVPAAWPFAAVLEFEGHGEALIDWTRRRRDSKDGGAWFLDPASTYVEHINAEVVCEHDGDRSYLAVVDTPTGEVMGSNEFLIRGRVTRPDGTTDRVGWWVWFDTPRNRRTERWNEQLRPLVDWRLSKARPGLAPWSVALDRESRTIAALGSKSVFTLPKVPNGMEPCVRR